MSENPYVAPDADVTTTEENSEHVYAGFWIRTGASIIDTILIVLVTWPVLIAIYGMAYFDSTQIIAGTWDALISYVFPAVAVLIFWSYRSATPGKMILNMKIIDAKSGQKPSTGQFVGRYFGYFVSMIPLMLGIIWVAFDKRKQGWHDKLAGTLVVKNQD